MAITPDHHLTRIPSMDLDGNVMWLQNCTSSKRTTAVTKSLDQPIHTSHPKGKMHMKNVLVRLWKEEEGQDLTEYALLLVLLSLAAIGALGTLANAINGTFTKAAGNLTT